jgi:hypothetical protein
MATTEEDIPRDPDLDVLLFGRAYGERLPDGSIRWLDPATVIIRMPGGAG